MRTKLRILDLFCGEGGAAQGYIDALLAYYELEVVGVDIKNYSKYYPGTFVQGDALDYLRKHGHEFDLIHASPPCQAYSIATAGNPAARSKHVKMIAETRAILEYIGKPYVIENVAQARKDMINPITLCGRMFNLRAHDTDGAMLVLDRHRLFESNFKIEQPKHPSHGPEQVAGVYGGSRRSSKPNATPEDDRNAARYERRGGYVPRSQEVRKALMGIDWMTMRGLAQSIPPVYTEYIGHQFHDAQE